MKLPENNRWILVEPQLARLIRGLAVLVELATFYFIIWGLYAAIKEVATWI